MDKNLNEVVKEGLDYYPDFKGYAGTSEINIYITEITAYHRKRLFKNVYESKLVIHKDKFWQVVLKRREFEYLLKVLEKPFKPYFNSSNTIGRNVITIEYNNEYKKTC